MKEKAFLINISRGGIVDEVSLIKALTDKKIAGAAVDVYSSEPPNSDFPLFNLPNVIVTPHIASNTIEARYQVSKAVFENVCNVIEGKLPKHPSNIVNKNVVKYARAFHMK
jgi:phosphoglycerate dehydrogenase-like enzyme